MGQSNNPAGTSRVGDQEIKDALAGVLKETDKLAAPASDVADRLPIKKQAVRKRLDKLVNKDSGVKRYRGAQAWHYYLAGLSPEIEREAKGTGREGKPNEAYNRVRKHDEENNYNLREVQKAERTAQLNEVVEIVGISVMGVGVLSILFAFVGLSIVTGYALGMVTSSALVIAGFVLWLLGPVGVAISLGAVVWKLSNGSVSVTVSDKGAIDE